MVEIPPAKDTDAEDVVWGLQTAETLWKRGERIDALVWLRRAAQAAGDANDDDRALELARHAAELTEWMAAAASMPPLTGPSEPPHGMSARPDPYLDEDEEEETTEAKRPPFKVESSPWAETALGLAATHTEPEVPESPAPEEDGRPSTNSVPPAEKVHAGMFDPWADQSSQMESVPPSQPSPEAAVPLPMRPQSPSIIETEEEVVTSVRPEKLAEARSDAPPISAVPISVPVSVAPPARPSRPNLPPARVPPKPPPLPPRARPPVPKSSPAEAGPEAPHIEITTNHIKDDGLVDVAVPDVEAYVPPPAELSTIPPHVDEPSTPPTPEPPALVAAPEVPPKREAALDLEDVEAFADLPDDARLAFAGAAKLHSLAEGEEIGTFALAYVVTGSFDVAATVVDAPAVRLRAGSVLRARGTTDEGVPMRLICAEVPPEGHQATVATWSDAEVEEAFRTIPWVEDDLRAAADRVQTLVGITIGPLGERLDVSIREEIVSRLTMRPLSPHEVVVKAGEAVPGLLLVGIGELELVVDDKVSGVVSSGDFLFPTEVLGAGSAPATARAGSGGAVVMFGDRAIAQELLVTCPPLLEVFAGM